MLCIAALCLITQCLVTDQSKQLKGCSILVYTVLLRSFWHQYCLATCCQATCVTSVLLGKELLPSVLLLLTIVLRKVYVVCIHNPSVLRELWEFCFTRENKITRNSKTKKRTIQIQIKKKITLRILFLCGFPGWDVDSVTWQMLYGLHQPHLHTRAVLSIVCR